MKAVFLDRDTFSPEPGLSAPSGLTDWQVYQQTADDTEEIVARLAGADIAVTNKVRLGREVLAQLPQLKMIQVTATGINNIDSATCAEFGIKVMNVDGYSTTSVSEHTFMLMLAAMRGIYHYHQAVISGAWQQDGKFCLNDLPLLDLQGKTLGVVGVGHIGRKVSEIARVFGMQVLWAERLHKPPRSADYCAFETVFAQADIITLHCPLTPETQGLINQQTLAFCQRQPLLINVARGPVVDSRAVVDALNDGRLSGYASDVFVSEPPKEDELLLTLKNHPRVLFTPHQAWASMAAQQKLWHIVCKQITAFVNENSDS